MIYSLGQRLQLLSIVGIAVWLGLSALFSEAGFFHAALFLSRLGSGSLLYVDGGMVSLPDGWFVWSRGYTYEGSTFVAYPAKSQEREHIFVSIRPVDFSVIDGSTLTQKIYKHYGRNKMWIDVENRLLVVCEVCSPEDYKTVELMILHLANKDVASNNKCTGI